MYTGHLPRYLDCAEVRRQTRGWGNFSLVGTGPNSKPEINENERQQLIQEEKT